MSTYLKLQHTFFSKKSIIYFILLMLICLIVGAQNEIKKQSGNKVLIIPLKAQIDKAMLFYLRRGFQHARDDKELSAIVIDMDTPGGELRITEEIISWIRSLNAEGLKIYSYVNSRAQSAGAIICLATDAIYMAPGSRIGSAAPILMAPGGGIQEMPDDIKEKILSDTRALVRGLAQEKGYIPELGAAMVDNGIEVKIGEKVVCAEGELLNLTAEEAIEIIPPREEPLLASGIPENITELVQQEGIMNPKFVTFQEHGAEKLARMITMIAPFLMTLGFLGIYMEMKSPGFGLPGLIGVCCIVLFLFGHFIAGLAGKEDILLVMIGFVLIAVEIFLIPGFGFCGVLGIITVIGGIIMAMIPHIPQVPDLPNVTFNPMIMESYLNRALLNMVLSIVISGAGMFVLAKYLPNTSLYGQLVLQTAESTSDGFVSVNIEENTKLIGKSGKTLTDLRPSGTAVFDDKRIDVVSNGDYIDKDEEITVIETNGPRIVVERIDPGHRDAEPI